MGRGRERGEGRGERGGEGRSCVSKGRKRRSGRVESPSTVGGFGKSSTVETLQLLEGLEKVQLLEGLEKVQLLKPFNC